MPRGVTMAGTSSRVAGGYFIWITLPAPLRAVDIVQRAQTEENLRLAPGELFQVAGDPCRPSGRFGDCVRLCYTFESPYNIVEGVDRLARVLDRAKEELV